MENDGDKVSSKIIPHQQIGLNRAGRPAGTPNKATSDARAAIALFVDGNAHRLQEWLDMIAHGYKVTDDEGNERITSPAPRVAYELFMQVV
jgi:hypothetical protein